MVDPVHRAPGITCIGGHVPAVSVPAALALFPTRSKVRDSMKNLLAKHLRNTPVTRARAAACLAAAIDQPVSGHSDNGQSDTTPVGFGLPEADAEFVADSVDES